MRRRRFSRDWLRLQYPELGLFRSLLLYRCLRQRRVSMLELWQCQVSMSLFRQCRACMVLSIHWHCQQFMRNTQRQCRKRR